MHEIKTAITPPCVQKVLVMVMSLYVCRDLPRIYCGCCLGSPWAWSVLHVDRLFGSGSSATVAGSWISQHRKTLPSTTLLG